MSFFFNEVRKAPKKPQAAKRGTIPIESLQKLGCSVCPRQETWPDLRTPQMEPTGAESPLIYILGTGPNEDEDDTGRHWTGLVGKTILGKLPKGLVRHARFGHITQCMPPKFADGLAQDLNVKWPEIECCRPRVISDIEQSKPLVIIGVGDKPLQWATKLADGATTMAHRGSLFPVKIGTHSCLFFSIMYPAFVFKRKKFGISEYELALDHDLAFIAKLVNSEDLPAVRIPTKADYDRGIEIITGEQPDDFKRLERALEDMAGWKQTGLDIETNGLRPWRLKNPMLLTAAVGTLERVVAFSIDHPYGWGAEARVRRVRALFGEFLLASNLKLAHNLAMEMEWINYFYGAQPIMASDWGDTMAMCHTFDERPGTKALEVQTVLGFGFNLKAQSNVDVRLPEWWLKFPLKDILRYNGMDSKWTEARARQLQARLADDDVMRAEYDRKVALAPALVLTEAKGLKVSLDRAEKIGDHLADQLADIERRITATPEIRQYRKQFGPFDPGNSDHVVKMLQFVCKREEVKRENRDGSISISGDEEVLSALPKDEVPSAPLILEHRSLDKLKSTYIEPVVSGRIISEDGLVHSKYSAMTAVTGRLAAEDPSAQNWPKRKHREVRAIFFADDDEDVVACDYGQIEFRVVGMASEDRNLVKYCWTGYDVHQYWAQRMVDEYPAIKDRIVADFGVDWDEKGLKTLRQESKNMWVFPQLFGSSLRSCAANLHLPDDVAEDLGAEFWDEFKGVKLWQERLLKKYERDLYVETLGGRRRRGPMTKNEIINMPIQGTACDIVTEAHVALCHRAYIEDQPEYQPNLNVHDDLSSWLKKKTRDQRVKVIVEEMCMHRFSYINVPLVVEVSVGPDWANLTEIAKYRSDQLFNLRNPHK